MDKLDILLAAIGKNAVLDRQEDCGVTRIRCVRDYVALDVVEAQDGQLQKIKPAIIKEAELVIDSAFDSRAQIKLCVQGIQLEPGVNVLSSKRGLINMDGVRALVGWNRWVHDRVEANSRRSNLYLDQQMWGEGSAHARGRGRVGHVGDARIFEGRTWGLSSGKSDTLAGVPLRWGALGCVKIDDNPEL